MWPWEHLAFGYLLYSGYAHAVHGDRPVPADAYALAFATQLPDLVDKPLAWTFGVLPSGTSLAHSVFVAVPVAAVAVLVARRFGAASIGRAFGFGYLSHLAGDVLYPLALTGGVYPDYLLWPFVDQAAIEPTGSLATTLRLLSGFGDFLATPRGVVYLALELFLLGVALALWTADGLPGLARPTP
jgi:hypothetical protein